LERQLLPRSDWQFGRLVDGAFTKDSQFIYLKTGFEPGRIYEVVYRTSTRPSLVSGWLLFAIWSPTSSMKRTISQRQPRHRIRYFPVRPLSSATFYIRASIADERDREVFDGIDAHVARGRPWQLQSSLC
jgi:hypothetical protein